MKGGELKKYMDEHKLSLKYLAREIGTTRDFLKGLIRYDLPVPGEIVYEFNKFHELRQIILEDKELKWIDARVRFSNGK